jgi:hypothetical protein
VQIIVESVSVVSDEVKQPQTFLEAAQSLKLQGEPD